MCGVGLRSVGKDRGDKHEKNRLEGMCERCRG